MFALLAILVACLGLFGLSFFSAARRTKEIGIRKALGATVTSIVALLSKEFLTLVLIGSGVAVPLVWIGMERWLSGFAYRVELPVWVSLAATALTLVIAQLTVAVQTLRAARIDPAQSLRYE